MKARIHESALDLVLGDTEITEGISLLMSAAYEVDRDQDGLAEAAEYMATQLRRFAADARFAMHDRQDPTGSSTLRDVTLLAARLEERRRAFWGLARVILGADSCKALRAVAARLSNDAQGLDVDGMPKLPEGCVKRMCAGCGRTSIGAAPDEGERAVCSVECARLADVVLGVRF